jgi:mono/diheme cytochrome c family protein
MKKTALILIAAFLLLPMASFADEALYKSKCVACHGADGKKSAKVDLTSETVQAKADDELVKFLTTNGIHKAKVTDEAQAKTLVAFLRTFKK